MKQVRKGNAKDTVEDEEVRKWRVKGGLPRTHMGQDNTSEKRQSHLAFSCFSSSLFSNATLSSASRFCCSINRARRRSSSAKPFAKFSRRLSSNDTAIHSHYTLKIAIRFTTSFNYYTPKW